MINRLLYHTILNTLFEVFWFFSFSALEAIISHFHNHVYASAKGKSKEKSLLTYNPSRFIFLCYTTRICSTESDVIARNMLSFFFFSAHLSYHALF